MNFWADVAFTPSSSGSSSREGLFPGLAVDRVGGFGISALTTGQSNRLLISAPAATPAGPALRRRIPRNNAHCPGLIVVSPTDPTGRDARVFAQEVVLRIGLSLRGCPDRQLNPQGDYT